VKLDESSKLEFKSSLRVCLKNKRPEKYIEYAVLKSIAALTNTSGGKLVIGVKDGGIILGLNEDYQSLTRKGRDGFELCLTSMMINNFGEAFSANQIAFEFCSIENDDICIVSVQRSSDLQFIEHTTKSGDKSKKLYARIGNSTREIPPEKISEFLDSRPE
jgi:predicted HTH transcriptional regulator